MEGAVVPAMLIGAHECLCQTSSWRLLRSASWASVDTSKAAINRHLKTGHFGQGG